MVVLHVLSGSPANSFYMHMDNAENPLQRLLLEKAKSSNPCSLALGLKIKSSTSHVPLHIFPPMTLLMPSSQKEEYDETVKLN